MVKQSGNLRLLNRACAAPPERIHENLQIDGGFTLENNTPPFVSRALDLGEVNGSQPLPSLSIYFALTGQQQKDLAGLLKRQLDRSSRDFHKWLTPQQFASRFGVNKKDLEKVESWLEIQGFTNIEAAPGGTHVTFAGTAAQVKATFGTAIHRYKDAAGQTHFANSSDPILPLGLRSVAADVGGLRDFAPRLNIQLANPAIPAATTGNQDHYLYPADLAVIYNSKPLLGAGVDGSGQSIAIVGVGSIDLNNIRTFRARAFLPPSDPTIISNLPPNETAGLGSPDEGEAELNIEVAGAAAPGATIVYVLGTDVVSAITTAVDNNVAPVLSISYSYCESSVSTSERNTLSTLFQQANAQGMTVLADSGDTGAANCDYGATVATKGLAVGIPASFPTVTAVGGTEFNEGSGSYWSSTNGADGGSALSYIPEVAWNDSSETHSLEASGGGKSILFGKPDWQKGLNVPNDNARDVPDVAFTASILHDWYGVCVIESCSHSQQGLSRGGGTSASTPFFAGLIALLNQKLESRVGNVNPELYTLASFSPDVFHDVTQRANQVPCQSGSKDCSDSGTEGYSAGPGYDQVTGLGSVDAYNLLEEWGADFNLSLLSTTLQLSEGATSNDDITVNASENFKGTISFTCTVPTQLKGVSCLVGGPITGSGTSNVSISRSSIAFAAGGANPNRPVGLFFLVLLSLLFIGSVWRDEEVSTVLRIHSRFIIPILTLIVLTMSACHDGTEVSSTMTTGPITGSVVVTATSGNLSHTAQITVTLD
ncbi:MAG TPA: S53 family peptidase [Bryobacteraceae bacterium]|nr:S53 family peptidase [Bryobacteraceae bacterium]